MSQLRRDDTDARGQLALDAPGCGRHLSGQPEPAGGKMSSAQARSRLYNNGQCVRCCSRLRTEGRRTCSACSSYFRVKRSAQYAALRKQVFAGGYGTSCLICHSKADLSIDHADGGGAAHWGAHGIRNSFQFYRWLVRNNLPPGFRVLCRSCNASIGRRATVLQQGPVKRQRTLFGGGE